MKITRVKIVQKLQTVFGQIDIITSGNRTGLLQAGETAAIEGEKLEKTVKIMYSSGNGKTGLNVSGFIWLAWRPAG